MKCCKCWEHITAYSLSECWYFAIVSQVYASTPLLLSLGNYKLLRYGGLQWHKLCGNGAGRDGQVFDLINLLYDTKGEKTGTQHNV